MIVESIDGLRLLLKVFLVEFLERDGADSSIGFVSLERVVSDQTGDVLFELSQVLNDIVLGESDAILVVHLLCDTQEELALLEHPDHNVNMLLNLDEHLLGFLGLVVVILNFSLKFSDFILQALDKIILLND